MQALLKPDVRLYLREVGIDITNAEFIFDVAQENISCLRWVMMGAGLESHVFGSRVLHVALDRNVTGIFLGLFTEGLKEADNSECIPLA